MKKNLQVRNMERTYGKRGNITKAVDGISFDVAEGEYIGIMGASGSGKTTLLNCFSTIDTITGGVNYH
jgi:putative ABC transport system ATP-binding protein